ncbi:hypothetical protein A3197_01675 [Candidatus Thiodiazotropha endoloripes]|nr:hypothetical protein A3197_01675 [Candidatus Thiodiazotropha endoloripes]
MLIDPTTERWPPTYDAKDLANTLKELLTKDRLISKFYTDYRDPNLRYCQGDIIRLTSPVPSISGDGEIDITDDYFYWMVIGNTCDIARDVKEVNWSQIVPLEYLGNDQELDDEFKTTLKKYDYNRLFYVPPWDRNQSGQNYIADFLRPVIIDKSVFDIVSLEARLDYYSWMLFHICLVRFLARDDGRNA